jgi:small-conductance mechanosensitive channel
MKKLLLLFCICLIAKQGISQESNEETNGSDSIRNSIIYSQSQQLLEMTMKRYKDSVRKSELEIEINNLKSSEYKKRQELRDQLKVINQQDSIEKAHQKHTVDSLREFVKGYPIVPFRDTLMYVYNRIGGFTPRVRATAISARIREIGEAYQFNEDSFHIEKGFNNNEIFYGDKVLMSVLLSDALWNNQNVDSLAKNNLKIIVNAIAKYREVNSTPNRLKRTGWILLVLIIMALIIFLIGRVFRYTNKWLEDHLEKGINGVKIKDYTLFNSSQELNIVLKINYLIKWLFIIIIIYLTLPLIFGLLPWAKNIADTLLGYILNPTRKVMFAVWNYLPNLFTIFVLSTIIIYIRKGFHYLSKEIESGSLKIDGFYKDWAKPTYQIISILLFAFLLIVVFPYLPGSDSPVFKGVSVFIGLLFTFGSTGSLSNVISGLVLTYTRAFKIGDRVKIGDTVGDVIEKSLLVSRLRTTKNEIISIPNTNVMNSHITNYSSEVREGKGLIIYSSVTIGYDAPWKQVHQLLINAALATELIEQSPVPFVLQTSLDDFYVSYQINAYTKKPNLQATIYSNLHAQIQEKFNAAGVEIMSPHYNAIRDGNASTIPSKNNDNDKNT